MVRTGSVYGPDGKIVSSGGFPRKGYWYQKASADQWVGLFNYLLNRIDDTPSKATRIEADGLGVAPDNISLHGLYNAYWTNDLSYVVEQSNGSNFSLTEDSVDWYVFRSAEAGSVYTIAGDYRESEVGIGRIFVYSSLTAANNGAASIEAAEANSFVQGHMNALTAGGFQFEVPVAGDIYIQFTRRQVAAIDGYTEDVEDISIEYRFTLQEGKSQKYGFVPNVTTPNAGMVVNAMRGDGHATVTLSRTNAKGADTVPYTLYGWFDGDTDATAFIGEDFDYPLGDQHVFSFKDGEETATIQIPVYDTLWDDTCHFYVSIDVGDSVNEEWVSIARVNILDSTSLVADGTDAPNKASVFNDPLFSDDGAYAAGTRLQPGDIADWFRLTNMSAGIICKLSVTGTENYWSGLSSLSAQVYSADGRTALAGKSTTVAKGERGEILFVTSVAGDYLLRVAPVGTSASTPLNAAYSLSMMTEERQVVSFAKASAGFPSPAVDTSVEFEVAVTGDVWPYSPRPVVKTVDVTSTAGTDYESFGASGKEVGEDGKVSLTLKDAGKWRPERTFTLVLEADPEGFYAIGDQSELTVTLAADDAAPSVPMVIANPIDVGDTLALAEGRNLSYTNTSDTLYFSVPAGNVVLAARNVTIKPDGTTINVTVYTNDVAYNATPWSLADLAEPDNMPMLVFSAPVTAKVEVVRAANDDVLATYSLGFTKWEIPIIEFEKGSFGVSQTNENVECVIRRSGDTQFPATVYVTLTCGTARDGVDVRSFVDLPVVIPAGESNAMVTVENLMAATPEVWKGDRTFTLELKVMDAKLALGDNRIATVTLESELPEYEDGDSAAESQTNPGVTSAMTAIDDAPLFVRRLNGADASDWFTFTGAKAGQSYRFMFDHNDLATNNIALADVKIEFALPGVAAAVTTNLAAVVRDGCWNSPILTQGGDITVRVWRPAGADVSAEYSLKAYEWPWPKMTFERDADEVDRDGEQTYSFKVCREDNLMLNDLDITNNVTIWLEGDATKYIFPRQTFRFVPGQAETNLAVTLACKRTVWTGDESFVLKMSVETDAAKEKIKTGVYTNLVVTVKDNTRQYDAADATDATAAGALEVADMDTRWNAVAAHLNGCEGRNTNPNIGDDTVDWYVFKGLLAGKAYRFEAQEVTAENVDAADVTVKFFFDPAKAEFAATTLSALADGYKTPKMEAGQTNVYVQVSRATAGELPVHLAYSLAYKMQANRAIYFKNTAVTVSEAASEFSVDVVCETEGELIDISPATATVTAVADSEGEHPASSPADFIAGLIQVVKWETNTVGNVRRVKVPLTNLDSVWEGDETFKLELTCDEDSELGQSRSVLVTITDIDEPKAGTIALTRVGDPLAKVSAAKTYAVREGDAFPVEVRRTGGFAGNVTGVWTWSSGTVVRRELFADRKDGLAVVSDFTIPDVRGVPFGEKLTCTFAVEGGATLAADSVKTLTFDVTDSDYAGPIEAYSLADASRLAFSATSSGWYDSVREGTVCAAMPSTLRACVKGPGTLSFTAKVPSGVVAKVRVSGGAEVTVENGLNVVEIGLGTKTVTVVAGAAGVEVSDVQFTPSEEFRKIGTYTGYAQVGECMGKVTLTVAQNGRVSGKFVCAGGTWTFTGKGGWTDGRIAATARSGGETLAALFEVDAATGRVSVSPGDGEARALTGMLERNCWSDKPMQPGEAAALSVGTGYYTATLPCDGCGSGYLTLMVSENGSMKASGVLADGQSVSMSATLLYGVLDGDGQEPYVYLFAAPSAYDGGWFHAFAKLSEKERNGEKGIVLRPFGDIRWMRNGAAPFDKSPGLSGGRYGSVANLANYYVSYLTVSNIADVADARMTDAGYAATSWGGGASTPATLNFNEAGTRLVSDGVDRDLFSVSFTKATGLFRGNEKVVYTRDGRTVTRFYSYRGALTPLRDEEDDVEGRGFFLIGDKSHEVKLVK